ncbi:hypothetical protein [Enterobacter cancerogenus]
MTKFIESKLWDGNPDVFGVLEDEYPGTITYIYDDDLEDYVWRFNKPSDQTVYRCESRNIRVDGKAYKWLEGNTYKLSWKSKITKIKSDYGDFVIFQWKSYPNGEQNYPLLMTANDDYVKLIYVDTSGEWHTLWQQTTVDGAWNQYELTIHLSSDVDSGWVELVYNGESQLLDGVTRFMGRTLDGSNEPKWGLYNRDNPGHAMEQFVGAMVVSIE